MSVCVYCGQLPVPRTGVQLMLRGTHPVWSLCLRGISVGLFVQLSAACFFRTVWRVQSVVFNHRLRGRYWQMSSAANTESPTYQKSTVELGAFCRFPTSSLAWKRSFETVCPYSRPPLFVCLHHEHSLVYEIFSNVSAGADLMLNCAQAVVVVINSTWR